MKYLFLMLTVLVLWNCSGKNPISPTNYNSATTGINKNDIIGKWYAYDDTVNIIYNDSFFIPTQLFNIYNFLDNGVLEHLACRNYYNGEKLRCTDTIGMNIFKWFTSTDTLSWTTDTSAQDFSPGDFGGLARLNINKDTLHILNTCDTTISYLTLCK